MKKLMYRSDNGYTGLLRPIHGFSIYDPNGREVLHTSSPAFSTCDEMIKQVDNFPHFLDVMFEK